MVEISEVPEKYDSRDTEAYLEPITLVMEFFAKKFFHKETPSEMFDRVLNTHLLRDCRQISLLILNEYKRTN